MAADSPRYANLVADTPADITFGRDWQRIEVCNVDGGGPVSFRIDGVTPVVHDAVGVHVLPAAIGAVELAVLTAGPTKVSFLAVTAARVQVRGIE